MSKPKFSNRDYGYQPNTAKDLLDMESVVPTDGMRMAGAIEKHSEFMRPNEEPYDDMEYEYPYPPRTMPPTGWTGPGTGWPPNRLDCHNLWNKIFPDHPTESSAFVPNRNDWSRLKTYTDAGCPVIYIPHWCCKGVKISGPKEVETDSITQYSVTNRAYNCSYDWHASAGRIPGGTFYAPSTEQDVGISVNPFMGDDSSKTCDSITVKVKSSGGCVAESIGISGTTQMSVGDTKTLTVLNAVVGKTYTWVISSGGGSVSPSTGTSTTYTAPASNANCLNNPAIQLKVGANVCDSVLLVVTNPAVSGQAGNTDYDPCSKIIDVGFPGKCGAGRGTKAIYCSGSFGAQSWHCIGGTYGEYYCGSPQLDNVYSFCGCPGPGSVSYTDTRTAEMKANGCCPYQLM